MAEINLGYVLYPGPVPSTIVDFWRMVWQERVPSVVMITNLVEGKKTKCEQYWPSSGSQDFGPFHISITHQLILADYTVRTLSVEVEKACFLKITVCITSSLNFVDSWKDWLCGYVSLVPARPRILIVCAIFLPVLR